MMYRALPLLAALAFFQVSLSVVNAQPDHSASIVEIYNLDKKLLGTGTIVSFSGLVLTAKHVLELPKTSTLRLTINVGIKNDTKLLDAELIAAHPYLDLAILKIVGGEVSAWPAIPVILDKKDVNANETIQLIGHKQSSEELHIERLAPIDNLDYSGHIQIGRRVDRGTSGGPAIYDGKVLGVIVESDFLEKTIVTPIWAARDYLEIVGVEFLGEGFAREQSTTATLIRRVASYEAVFTDILLDLDWSARLKLDDADNGDGDRVGDLWIGFARKLRAQPMMNARLLLAAGTTLGEGGNASQKIFILSKWIEPPARSVRFEQIHRELQRIAPGADTSKLDYLDLKIRVEPDRERISGYVAKFQDIPDFEICFQLGPSNSGYMEGEAAACGETHAYLDKIIERGVH